MRTALTIAGSDSGAGAGIQADLKTFAAHGVYGTCAITAVTAQNTQGVVCWQALQADLVIAQIEAVVSDIGADAVKIGMLANAAIAEAVAAAIRALDLPEVVVDPVMVAKGGDRLLSEEAVATMRAELLPLAHVVTPNIPEAEVLAGISIRSLDDMKDAATRILRLGPRVVLVKGGHAEGPESIDVCVSASDAFEIRGGIIFDFHLAFSCPRFGHQPYAGSQSALQFFDNRFEIWIEQRRLAATATSK